MNSASTTVVPFDVHWKPLLECAALEVFELMAGVKLELSTSASEDSGPQQTAMVGMAGALCGMTTVRCSVGAAGKLASLMLGEDAGSNPATARDALGELCNMIAGNFKAKVNTLADHCMLSVPTVITGVSYSLDPAEPSVVIDVTLAFEGECIFVALITHT
jgi:chemotaxis protein CheX